MRVGFGSWGRDRILQDKMGRLYFGQQGIGVLSMGTMCDQFPAQM
jgi:hypothetical protein